MPAPKLKQKPKKIYPVGGQWLDDLNDFGQKAMQKLFGFTLNWDKQKSMLKNNFDLGLMHIREGHYSDAVFRFKIVTWIDPKHAGAWYYLGRALLATGKRARAIEALTKALRFKPGHSEIEYMLAVAQGAAAPQDKLPTVMPVKLVQEHFDLLAPTYAKDQVETLGYKGHLLISEAVRPSLMPGRADHVILDIGCGSGLCGQELRDIALHITGIDISPKMTEQAAALHNVNGRRIYDVTIARDFHPYLQGTTPESFDIVLAGGVTASVGDLEPLFSGVPRLLKKDGLFALTADKLDGTDGFRLDAADARFRFSDAYLTGLGKAHGLTQLRCDSVDVYPGYPAWLCVFRK